MGVFDILIATAIFAFFFFYTIYFISSVQLELRAPTKIAADEIFDTIKVKIYRLPIKINANTQILSESFEIPVGRIFGDENSLRLKLSDEVLPTEIDASNLIFSLNNTNNTTLSLFFTNATNRTLRSYITDLVVSQFPQYFEVKNSFYSSKIYENCNFSELKIGSENLFERGIEINEIASGTELSNISTLISCNNISYRFFYGSPKIRVRSSTPVNISLAPIFSKWETPDSSGDISTEIKLTTERLILYTPGSKLLFLEFDKPTNLTILPISSTQEITTTESPVSYSNSGWTNPTGAYSDDTSYAYTSTDGATVTYDYDFNILADVTITKVEVGVKAYTTSSSTEDLVVYVYDGSSWYSKTATDYSSETLQWLDFTSSTTWTPSKVNAIKTKLLYVYTGGGGCYPNYTEILAYKDDHYIFMPPSKMQVGDKVVCWNEAEGIHLCRVTKIERHLGNFKILSFSVGDHRLDVTPNHPIWSPELERVLRAEEFVEGMTLLCLDHGEVKKEEITQIKDGSYNGYVYNIKTNESLSPFFSLSNVGRRVYDNISEVFGIDLIPKSRTYKVNWLPVRVTYQQQTMKEIKVIIEEPANFSIYATNYSDARKEYYKNRKISVEVGSLERINCLTNESIQAFLNQSYDTIKSKVGHNFFLDIKIEDEGLSFWKGEAVTDVKRLEERKIFYYDEDFNKSLAVVKIGIW